MPAPKPRPKGRVRVFAADPEQLRRARDHLDFHSGKPVGGKPQEVIYDGPNKRTGPKTESGFVGKGRVFVKDEGTGRVVYEGPEKRRDSIHYKGRDKKHTRSEHY